MTPVLAFLFGLLIGSFLNVCIYRMPKEESIVRPRSRCPHCGSPIRWYDNIPLLSFVWLGGRCRDCGAAISFLYPAVELITGLLFAVLAARFGLTLGAAKYALFVSMMLILGFADLNDRLLPDEITLGGAAAGLVFSVVRPLRPDVVHLALLLAGVSLSPRLTSLAESAVAAGVGAGVLYLVAEVYYRVRFREGMGFGDVKMMALIGSFLGLRQALFAVMLASVLGAVLGLVFIGLFRKGLAYELPFGTFLAFASIVLVIYGNEAA
ncbi:MAG TPA: prepilin peptidase [Bryobacterales bacterium]|nr:prepilin peptidase [Bryobacterales bacterium]